MKTIRVVAWTLIVIVTLSCRGTPGRLSDRLVGKWRCERREVLLDPAPAQTEWKRPCTLEYFADGTSEFTEDGVRERGRYTFLESDNSIVEWVTASDAKERIGHKSKGKVTLADDRLSIEYDSLERRVVFTLRRQ